MASVQVRPGGMSLPGGRGSSVDGWALAYDAPFAVCCDAACVEMQWLVYLAFSTRGSLCVLRERCRRRRSSAR